MEANTQTQQTHRVPSQRSHPPHAARPVLLRVDFPAAPRCTGQRAGALSAAARDEEGSRSDYSGGACWREAISPEAEGWRSDTARWVWRCMERIHARAKGLASNSRGRHGSCERRVLRAEACTHRALPPCTSDGDRGNTRWARDMESWLRWQQQTTSQAPWWCSPTVDPTAAGRPVGGLGASHAADRRAELGRWF